MNAALLRCSLFVLLAVSVTGCSVDAPTPPDVVPPGALGGKDALPTLLAGAVGDFAVAYAGRPGVLSVEHAGVILLGGLLTDELGNSAQISEWVAIDRRVVTEFNDENQALYLNLHRARAAAERAAGQYAALDPTALGRAFALDLAAYTYVLFGETYCGNVPFSQVDPEGNIAYGAALTTPEILRAAVARFDSVLDLVPRMAAAHPDAADSVSLLNMVAQVGRARALLDLGEYAEAGRAVDSVPTTFVFRIEYGTNSEREKNAVYHFNQEENSYVVSDSEGINGIPYASGGDPRTPVRIGDGSGVDERTVPFYLELAYPRADSPIPLATGVEARLIQAEALLQAGDAAAAMSLLNALRATAGIAPAPDPGATEGRVSFLFRERALWLWLTGHRLGDLRRLVGAYGRASEAVYPTGAYPKYQTTYGTAVDLPVPVDERTNPLYDPSSCHTTVP